MAAAMMLSTVVILFPSVAGWASPGRPASAFIRATAAPSRTWIRADGEKVPAPPAFFSPAPARERTGKLYWEGTLFLTLKGSKGNNSELALRVELIEEDGYEPPQGFVRIDACPAFREGARTRWILSEDPTERRDGLWIWGLFKQPLYPFVLLELELDVGCVLPDGRELEAGIYYLTGGHKGEGPTLLAGTISRKVALDVPLVGSSATYMEPFECGSYVARQA